MSAPDAPPPIPTQFQIYDSYAEDPKWQRKFTVIWASLVAAAIIVSVPHFLKSIRKGYTWTTISGIHEDLSRRSYEPVGAVDNRSKYTKSSPSLERPARHHGVVALLRSFSMWTAPHVGLDLGQIILVVLYYIVLLVCITLHAPLIDNPNRAGFMALAQLPVVFLFATKNSLLSLALGSGRGWEKLNFLHKWSGRGMFLAASIHGSLWIHNHIQFGLPIIGQQKEGSGVAAYGLLCAIVLTSLKPVRALAYQFFFLFHILFFVGFFITICYHTIYASPWIFPPMAFYGLDLLLRMFRFRVKDATLIACDDNMTLIKVHNCDGGWVAGQHVRLRVFFDGRLFESHPLTILTAPPRTTCLGNGGLILGARAKGDWSRALNKYAMTYGCTINDRFISEPELVREASGKTDVFEAITTEKKDSSGLSSSSSIVSKEYRRGPPEDPEWESFEGAEVQVMLEGPYGGSSVDLGEFESILLVAGGAGATFTLGMLDDIVGRCVKLNRPSGERTRRIEFVWCMRSFGCMLWLSPMLKEIARLAENSTIDLHISIFVTCLCDPEAVPIISNCDVLIERPTIRQLLTKFVVVPTDEKESCSKTPVYNGGGLAVCVAGPEPMIRETKNGLAHVALAQGVRLGNVVCHSEIFSL